MNEISMSLLPSIAQKDITDGISLKCKDIIICLIEPTIEYITKCIFQDPKWVHALQPKQDMRGLGYDPYKNASEFREKKNSGLASSKGDGRRKPFSIRDDLLSSRSEGLPQGLALALWRTVMFKTRMFIRQDITLKILMFKKRLKSLSDWPLRIRKSPFRKSKVVYNLGCGGENSVYIRSSWAFFVELMVLVGFVELESVVLNPCLYNSPRLRVIHDADQHGWA